MTVSPVDLTGSGSGGGTSRTTTTAGRAPMVRRIAPALGLFLLSPLVAEFLLGNLSITAIVGLFYFAPMYGGGAVLIREVTRRTGRGWPTMILLAVAYGVIEEGLVIQTLFNPSYFDRDLLSAAWVPTLGIGAWWTLFVLALHTVWSISVPIALIETLVPDRRTTPWLGGVGLTVAGVLFALGALLNFAGTYHQERFLASVPQLVGAAVAVVALVATAFLIGRHPRSRTDALAPHPWLVGAVSLAASSLVMIGRLARGWPTVAGCLVLYVAIVVLVMRWSRRQGWGAVHRLALAGGALLAYAWNAFLQVPVLGATGVVDLIGNVVFALAAVALLIWAWRAATAAAPPRNPPSET